MADEEVGRKVRFRDRPHQRCRSRQRDEPEADLRGPAVTMQLRMVRRSGGFEGFPRRQATGRFGGNAKVPHSVERQRLVRDIALAEKELDRALMLLGRTQKAMVDAGARIAELHASLLEIRRTVEGPAKAPKDGHHGPG